MNENVACFDEFNQTCIDRLARQEVTVHVENPGVGETPSHGGMDRRENLLVFGRVADEDTDWSHERGKE